jgi:glutaredoxin-like protein
MENKIIKMYGANWCPDASRARKFFDGNGIRYDWFDIDTDQKAADFVRSQNNGEIVIPTIVYPDGSILIEPSDEQLLSKHESLRHVTGAYDV